MRAQHRLGSAHEDDLTTLAPGMGAEVDDVIGSKHHVLVVLDDDDRVADVAQGFQRADETLIVALVEPDAGLVEDVEHIDQLRTDLRGQAYALALTAREGHRRA